MIGYVKNIENTTLANENFRQVLFTAQHSQLVVMSIPAGEDIGEETHDLDQFLRIEQGQGQTILNGEKQSIEEGFAVLVPAGTKHNIINTGNQPLKLYSLYSPPNHRDQVIHPTKEAAMTDDEHFDGQTTPV